MKLKSLVLSALIAGAAFASQGAAAQAIDRTAPLVTAGDGVGGFNAHFGDTFAASTVGNTFTDIFTFNIGTPFDTASSLTFLFVNARTVDAHAYGGEGALEQMREDAAKTLEYFVDFCQSHGMASASYIGFGTDAVDEITRMCEQINREYPNTIFFTSKLIFARDNWFTRLLHNQAALAVQRRLHLEGLQMVILPMKV